MREEQMITALSMVATQAKRKIVFVLYPQVTRYRKTDLTTVAIR